jgi:hypothetical protein
MLIKLSKNMKLMKEFSYKWKLTKYLGLLLVHSVCERANGNWRIFLQFSLVFLYKSEILESRLLCLLTASCWFLSWFIFPTVERGATYSSETSVDFQRTTRRYFLEERTLHNHRCENLKPYRFNSSFESGQYTKFVAVKLCILSGGVIIDGASIWD